MVLYIILKKITSYFWLFLACFKDYTKIHKRIYMKHKNTRWNLINKKVIKYGKIIIFMIKYNINTRMKKIIIGSSVEDRNE